MQIEKIIEKSVDEVIAVLVVGSALWNSTNYALPEWHVAAVGMVLMYYFGRKIRQGVAK